MTNSSGGARPRAARFVGTTRRVPTCPGRRPTGSVHLVYLPAISRTRGNRLCRSSLLVRLGGFLRKISFRNGSVRQRLNRAVICESMDVPSTQPLTDRQPVISRIGSTESGPAGRLRQHSRSGQDRRGLLSLLGVRHSRDHNFRAAKFYSVPRPDRKPGCRCSGCAAEFFWRMLPCPFPRAIATVLNPILAANCTPRDRVRQSRARQLHRRPARLLLQRIEGRYARAH